MFCDIYRRVLCVIFYCWTPLFLYISHSLFRCLTFSLSICICKFTWNRFSLYIYLSWSLSLTQLFSHSVSICLSALFLFLSSPSHFIIISLYLRICDSLNEALVGELITAEHLAMINPYQPNLAACWMFQRAMSVKIGSKPKPGLIVGTYITWFT